MSKRWMLSLMLMMSMVLAACGREEVTAENIISKIQTAQASTNDLHAVMRLDFTSPQDTGFVVAELWSRKTGTKDEAGNDVSALRFKVLEASEADAVGAEAVFDGDKGWAYSPKENTAYVGSKADLQKGMNGQEQEGGAGAMDQAAAMGELQKVLEKGLAAVDIEILGEEEIAGINTYKVKITPKKDAQAELQLPIDLLVETTAWIDSERWMPLKVIIDAKSMGKIELVAQTLEINPGLGADLFSAQPPAGAKIVNIAEMVKQKPAQGAPANLDEAKAKAGFPVLAPAGDTGGAVLVDIQIIDLPQGKAVIQNYAGAGKEWSLVQTTSDDQRSNAGGKGTEVQVRGQKGSLIEGAGAMGTLLTWKEGDVRIVLAGKLSAAEAQAIADGLK